MHRTLMAGMSLMALFAVAGCVQDTSGRPVTNAGSAGFGRIDGACQPGNMDPNCISSSRLGSAGASWPDGGNTTMYGTSDDPAFGVQPQNRRGTANRPGAGMPIEPSNNPPSLSPGTLSGNAGKRTTGEPGGN
ncbi:hypothetical protein [Azospirillum sp. sgz301742]